METIRPLHRKRYSIGKGIQAYNPINKLTSSLEIAFKLAENEASSEMASKLKNHLTGKGHCIYGMAFTLIINFINLCVCGRNKHF